MGGSILILGAGIMQGPAIQSAKKLGLKTFVIDANPDAPCVGMADCFEQIDLKSREKIARFALRLKEEEGLRAVFTAGTDFSANVAYACEQCGLPGHSFAAAMNASNKVLMRSCFERAGVPSPKFFKVERSKKAYMLDTKFLEKLVFPYVVKPVDSMGARGCQMVRSIDELDASLEEAFSYSACDTAILEEYMEGAEFSIDALLYDGTLTITGFADRHIFFEPYFVEMGHTMPSNTTYKHFIDITTTFARAIKSLGLTHGAAKGDVKLTKNGAMIGEVAARLSGGYMSGWTYPYSSGLDLTTQAILLSIGERPTELEESRFPLEIKEPYHIFSCDCNMASAERAWLSIPGVVKEIIDLEEARNVPFVRDIHELAKVGDTVRFPKSNVEKCGNVISVAPTREAAVLSAEHAAGTITMLLEKDNAETENFLFDNIQANSAQSVGSEGQQEPYPPPAFVLPADVFKSFMNEIERNSDKKILQSDGILKLIPPSILPLMELKDWNNVTLRETIEKFERMDLNYGEVNYKRFWLALIRGGIQGALYVVQ